MKVLDISRKEIPYEIGGKQYVLREASGGAATRYKDAQIQSAKLNSRTGKAEKLTGLAETEPLLISLCLFEQRGEGKEILCPLGTIKSWPNRIQRELFEEVKRISDLAEGSTQRELLAEALAKEGAPVTMDALREYVALLPQGDYGDLIEWLAETPEELAKNESSG